jgi:NADH-quinone oxidoreductase subunit J
MLLGVDQPAPLTEHIKGQRWVAALLGASLVAEVGLAVRLGIGYSHGKLPDFTSVNRGGNVQALAQVLFNSYFFPFEVTSILLIVAAIGAMLHGRRSMQDEETIDAPGDPGADEPVEVAP